MASRVDFNFNDDGSNQPNNPNGSGSGGGVPPGTEDPRQSAKNEKPLDSAEVLREIWREIERDRARRNRERTPNSGSGSRQQSTRRDTESSQPNSGSDFRTAATEFVRSAAINATRQSIRSLPFGHTALNLWDRASPLRMALQQRMRGAWAARTSERILPSAAPRAPFVRPPIEPAPSQSGRTLRGTLLDANGNPITPGGRGPTPASGFPGRGAGSPGSRALIPMGGGGRPPIPPVGGGLAAAAGGAGRGAAAVAGVGVGGLIGAGAAGFGIAIAASAALAAAFYGLERIAYSSGKALRENLGDVMPSVGLARGLAAGQRALLGLEIDQRLGGRLGTLEAAELGRERFALRRDASLFEMFGPLTEGREAFQYATSFVITRALENLSKNLNEQNGGIFNALFPLNDLLFGMKIDNQAFAKLLQQMTGENSNKMDELIAALNLSYMATCPSTTYTMPGVPGGGGL